MNYNTPHQFYCGVDLHARSMYVHVLDHKGKTRFEGDPKIGRSVYHLWRKQQAFDLKRFLKG